MFSQKRVADFINQSFEPVWESVRPVPIVRIDFGDGNVLTRTLHGNILTSICTPDGLVVDALPGIYTENAYVAALQRLLVPARGLQGVATVKRDAIVRAYHRQEIVQQARAAAGIRLVDITKTAVIEKPVVQVVQTNNNANVQYTLPPEVENPAEWKALQEDTRINETTRRRQIHEMLASKGLVRPETITRPIYKDVLHADLDDPYLGLREALFARYPFAKEDAAR